MLDKNRFLSLTSYIDYLKSTDLPIFIYGMGDGCLKLLKIFSEYSIPCAGIFASDEFVRDKVFEGHRIHKLSEIEDAVEEFVIVLAFGAGYRSLIEKIDSIASKHRLIVPDMPVIGEGLFTKEYMLEHFESLEKVHSLLSDDISKKVFEDLIAYKITGDISYLKDCETASDEAYRLLDLSDNERYADLGAYTGDTITEFLSHTGGKYEHIYAFEPDKRNFRKLLENTSNLSNITLLNAAAGSENGTVTVTKGGGRMIKKSSVGIEISQLTLDSVLSGEKITYIKYDVEGAEKEALIGSESSLRMYKPKLNVALYHRVGDMFELPLYISSLYGKARMYIRHFPYYPAWDTDLYVLP